MHSGNGAPKRREHRIDDFDLAAGHDRKCATEGGLDPCQVVARRRCHSHGIRPFGNFHECSVEIEKKGDSFRASQFWQSHRYLISRKLAGMAMMMARRARRVVVLDVNEPSVARSAGSARSGCIASEGGNDRPQRQYSSADPNLGSVLAARDQVAARLVAGRLPEIRD
jgi:hypothetical protein